MGELEHKARGSMETQHPWNARAQHCPEPWRAAMPGKEEEELRRCVTAAAREGARGDESKVPVSWDGAMAWAHPPVGAIRCGPVSVSKGESRAWFLGSSGFLGRWVSLRGTGISRACRPCSRSALASLGAVWAESPADLFSRG